MHAGSSDLLVCSTSAQLPLPASSPTCWEDMLFCPWWLPPPYHVPAMPSFLFTWSHCHQQSEAIPESLKNMLLVMDTAEIFHNADARGGSPSALWEITWERIDCFLPHLRDELFKQTVIQGRGLSSALSKESSSESLELILSSLYSYQWEDWWVARAVLERKH